ncbi:UDP-N-acetylmuramoyl-L-alanine--D-glutamate ligase [Candidatus Parcubacteria bacterium]|nr:UDP-N-acetylmuramoyl-L-alanine--D-glutamate ligase [Candidatus Parcubacteria bacterium]
MDWREYFKGKKITLIGLGLLGRGVGDAKFLAENGADLIVTDLKTEKELAESVGELIGFKNIQFVLGEHRLEDFQNRDFILNAAGAPLDSPFIAEARKNKIPIEMSTSLFAKLTEATLVGVTGTRGKSTTTQLIYEILKKTFGEQKVFLGGNVKGVSTLAFLPRIKKGDFAVLELDSWQLQGFGEARISPHIAVFTTFLPDHQNYYKGDMDRYLDDKANIFKNQTKDDFLILGSQAASIGEKKYKISSQKIIADENDLPRNWTLKIPGEHNRYNAGLALACARVMNISDDVSRSVIEGFSGVPGRLEFVCELHGIKIYNDTTATTPDATIAGLKALGATKNIVLIMGGANKNLDMTKLINEIPNYTKKVILLPGTGTQKIISKIRGGEETSTLKGAVKMSLEYATKGDIILFSPAFASFGMFKNEFDRGDQFLKLIKNL